MSKKGKILIISYFFPPEAGGGGAIRVVKFIRRLRELGWEVVVLTVKRRDTFMPDTTLLKQIEGVPVYRAGDYFRGIIRHILIVCGDIKTKLFGLKAPGALRPKKISLGRLGKFIGKAKKLLFDIICIPDECVGWILPAIWRGRRIIEDEGVDIIFSTSPPFSVHLVAKKLKERYDLPIVLDYRDRWVGSPAYEGSTAWRKRLNGRLEREVVAGSDFVVTTTPGQAEHIRKEYNIEKVKVIWNGYDEDDFDFKQPEKTRKKRFMLSHVGKLIGGRTIQPLLKAMEALPADLLEDMELHLAGLVSSNNETIIGSSSVAGNIKILGALDHRDAIRSMFANDVLIIVQFIEDDGMNAVPSKVFEYMRVARPILAICPLGSEVWRLVEENAAGVCVDTSDIEGIKNALISFHTDWKEGTLETTMTSVPEKFNRKRQAEELSTILEEVLKGVRHR